MSRLLGERRCLATSDPFRYLPTESAQQINDLLDPPDTERMRRVCRSWKALSELLNGEF